MNESAPVNKSETLVKKCSELGIEVLNNCADLTKLSAEEATNFLRSLLDSGEVVLHGTSNDEVYGCLETRQGHCIVKESGRKKAVYATDEPLAPISRAVLSRKYINSKFKNYTWGTAVEGDNIKFRFPPEIYQLFQAHDPNLFADGYVYVLDRSNFVNAPDAHGEWHSESNQEPILACKISKAIAKDIYIVGTDNDTVTEFNFDKK